MNTQAPSGLRAEGFRYVYQDGQFVWRHPLEVKPGAVDCSDMDDDEFTAFVIDHSEVAA